MGEVPHEQETSLTPGLLRETPTPPPKWENPKKKDLSKIDAVEADNFWDFPNAYFGDMTEATYPIEGEVSAQNERLHITLSYKPHVPRHPLTQIMINQLTKHGNFDAESTIIEEPKRLTGFTLTGENIEKPLVLTEIVPKGWKVLYRPDREGNFGVSSTVHPIILIKGDLTKIGTVLTLLHECGHAQKMARMGIRERLGMIRSSAKVKILKGNTDDLEVFLDQERGAWAFALEKIRPFIKAQCHSQLTAEKVKTYIHDYCLHSYNERIAAHINPEEYMKPPSVR